MLILVLLLIFVFAFLVRAFAGMSGDHYACQSLAGYSFVTSFYAERDATALKFLSANLHADAFTDVCDPSFLADAPGVDFVCGGFPCQTFSKNGQRAGLSDPRGVLVLYLLLYVRRWLPRMLLLENVKNLWYGHAHVLLEIVSILKSLFGPNANDKAYFVIFRILNTMEYGGIPHQRERVYIVAIKRLPVMITIASFFAGAI